jgi:hypothetical protein
LISPINIIPLVRRVNDEITISKEEELRLRKSCEFGAYLLITQCLAKTYGISELERFAKFWGRNCLFAK